MRGVPAAPMEHELTAQRCSRATASPRRTRTTVRVRPTPFSGRAALWIREALQWEQPRVTYRNTVVFSAQGWRGAVGAVPLPFERVWTTSPVANALLGADVLLAPLLQSYATDDNLDGVTDVLHVTVSLPLASDEVVTSAQLLAAVDVDLVVRVSGVARVCSQLQAGIVRNVARMSPRIRSLRCFNTHDDIHFLLPPARAVGDAPAHGCVGRRVIRGRRPRHIIDAGWRSGLHSAVRAGGRRGRWSQAGVHAASVDCAAEAHRSHVLPAPSTQSVGAVAAVRWSVHALSQHANRQPRRR